MGVCVVNGGWEIIEKVRKRREGILVSHFMHTTRLVQDEDEDDVPSIHVPLITSTCILLSLSYSIPLSSIQTKVKRKREIKRGKKWYKSVLCWE